MEKKNLVLMKQNLFFFILLKVSHFIAPNFNQVNYFLCQHKVYDHAIPLSKNHNPILLHYIFIQYQKGKSPGLVSHHSACLRNSIFSCRVSLQRWFLLHCMSEELYHRLWNFLWISHIFLLSVAKKVAKTQNVTKPPLIFDCDRVYSD